MTKLWIWKVWLASKPDSRADWKILHLKKDSKLSNSKCDLMIATLLRKNINSSVWNQVWNWSNSSSDYSLRNMPRMFAGSFMMTWKLARLSPRDNLKNEKHNSKLLNAKSLKSWVAIWKTGTWFELRNLLKRIGSHVELWEALTLGSRLEIISRLGIILWSNVCIPTSDQHSIRVPSVYSIFDNKFRSINLIFLVFWNGNLILEWQVDIGMVS